MFQVTKKQVLIRPTCRELYQVIDQTAYLLISFSSIFISNLKLFAQLLLSTMM